MLTKAPHGLSVRTIVRTRIKIGMANLAYDFQRQIWLDSCAH